MAVGPNQVDALANAVFQRFKESGAGSINHGAQASSLIFLVFRVHLAKAAVRKREPCRSPGRHSMDVRKEMTIWEKWCLKQKKEKQPEEGPKKL